MDLINRLRVRAEIRRQITTRKSVQNNEPDRISDLPEEAANAIEELENENLKFRFSLQSVWQYIYKSCTINSIINKIKASLLNQEIK